ncbi:amidohydrolase family protein [Paraburkholderia sp.]|uniref:amidohydrolase family protein n=1 Tax=Paraburkholderia sp. TaxID=1926495 RepID=UPI0039E60F14
MEGTALNEAEAILDPGLPIIDAHHHIWNAAHGKFDYLMPDLLADAGSGHNIVDSVYCECKSMFREDGPVELRPVGETEFVLDAIERGGPEATHLFGGLVMYADLMLGAGVQRVIDAHRDIAGDRLKGIRNIAAHDPSPLIRSFVPHAGMLAEPALREGTACLARNGLVFETFVFHPQLDEVAALARAQPELTIIVVGVGGPLGVGPFKGRRQEVFDTWRAALKRLAVQPNVNIQIGAFGAKMMGLGFHTCERRPDTETYAKVWSPYVDACLDAFGPARCMFTSNYPEDRSSISYRQLWNVYKYICRDLSDADRRRVFSGTAANLYKLPVQEAGIDRKDIQ